jgi:seryl-tRNA synthetase
MIEIDGPAPDPERVAALLRAGAVVVDGDEVVGLAGPALALTRRLLALFERLGAAFAAEPRVYPTLIAGATLARTDYFTSFPHQATVAAHVDEPAIDPLVADLRAGRPVGEALHGRLAAPDKLLSPAVCYHCYAELRGSSCPDPLHAYAATGRCFRREHAGSLRPLARQREFTMHEVILVGAAGPVQAARERLLARVVAVARRLGLRGRVVPAHDPFYGSTAGRARQVLQLAAHSKLELVVDCGDVALAIASFNRHDDYFGRAFAIAGPDGGHAHTACVAFGVERWLRAVVAARGADPADWHAALRAIEEEP